MSALMKVPLTRRARVIIEIPRHRKSVHFISMDEIAEVQAYLKKHAAEDEGSVEWKLLAKDRIEKYKKAGIVLRGARYRENLSQKELAKRSKVTQDDISKIENGKRTIGEKVAKRLARVLNIDYKMLLKSD